MKQTKHILLILIFLLSAFKATGYNYVVNGIYYEWLGNLSLAVTNKGTLSYGSYSGAVVIPSSVFVSGPSQTYFVTEIGSNAFYNCSSLTSVSIPENVTTIGVNAFYNCSKLTSVNIPAKVTSIESSTFSNCSSLGSITLPENLTSIGNSAFRNCTNLASITIPESVVSIGENAFEGTSWYESLFDGVVYINKVLYKYKGTMPKNTAIKVEEGTISISSHAFCDCSNLSLITIPNSVTYIGDYAFDGCRWLPSITISAGVTAIGSYAFSRCYSFTSITCKAEIPPVIRGSSTFEGVDKSIPVYVPASSVEAYQAAEYWRDFTNIQPIAEGYDLTVSAAGYATLFLDYAVAIPEEVEVYIASSVEGDRLMMTEVEGVLPANTGVIVRAKAGEHTFVESDDAPANVEGNLLTGTTINTYITAAPGYKYYVLAQKDGVVGMYRPKLTDGQFLNNANKAYLALKTGDLGFYDDEVNTEEDQLSNRLRFDFGGTTTIEKTTDKRSSLAGGKSNGQQTTVIYDLQGRRVAHPTKGINIIKMKDGSTRKVLVK